MTPKVKVMSLNIKKFQAAFLLTKYDPDPIPIHKLLQELFPPLLMKMIRVNFSITFLYLISHRQEQATTSPNMSNFDVHINPKIISSIKSDTSTMNALSDMANTQQTQRESDAESITSSATGAEELKLPLNTSIQVNTTLYNFK